MAEEEEKMVEEQPAKKAKLPKPILMLGIGLPVIVFQLFTANILVKQIFFSAPAANGAASVAHKDLAEIGEFYIVNDLIINPAATGGRRHLMVSLGLEYHNPLVAEELARRDPQIRDNLITLLGGQEVSVLADIKYREDIRRSLLKAINYYLTEGKVERLYFVKYVFQ